MINEVDKDGVGVIRRESYNRVTLLETKWAVVFCYWFQHGIIKKWSVDDLRLKVPWLSVHGGGENGLPGGGGWDQRGLHCVRCGQQKIWNFYLNQLSQSLGRQWVHLPVRIETRDDEPWRKDVRRGMQLTSWGGYLQFMYMKQIMIDHLHEGGRYRWRRADQLWGVTSGQLCQKMWKYFQEFCLMMGSVGSYCKGDSSWTNWHQ